MTSAPRRGSGSGPFRTAPVERMTRTLDEVQQFPHIARPGMPYKNRHEFFGNALYSASACGLRNPLQNGGPTKGCLPAVHARATAVQQENAEPIEEVTARNSRSSTISKEIPMCRADHPHIRVNGGRAAETLELPFLNYAKKLWL